MTEAGGGEGIRALVLTASDRASAGVYEDRSGPAAVAAIEEFLPGAGLPVEVGRVVVPDDRDELTRAMAAAVAEGCRLIVTTGGTGIGPRDVTPEATRAVIEREIPGLMEEVRRRSSAKAPGALLSRGVAGVRGGCLIVNLPGSVKAVRECLAVVLPLVPHALEMASGGGHGE